MGGSYHKSMPEEGVSAAASRHAPRVAVVVLGDLGRSPRMLYHALALAAAQAHVDLVGYCETDLDAYLSNQPAIDVHALRAPASDVPAALFIVHGIVRVLRQSAELAGVLRRIGADTILVQTPPAIPTLLVALAIARAHAARLVVDWHNFGWSMLALRIGGRHPLTRLARRWEWILGRRADAHLCVSRAMAAELKRDAGIHAVVLYDRPAERFHPASAPARAAIRNRLAVELRLAESPLMVIAPTGWTADEDMGLLIDAAVRLDALIAAASAAVPDVVIVASGRGPLRGEWDRRVTGLALRHVHLQSRWLPAPDYPSFLAAADVGVSLHRSASGVDLPMKIADLLGAGVPICALAYGPCLAEVLRDGETGLLFETAGELAAHLWTLLSSATDDRGALQKLRRNIAAASPERWRDGWTAAARPVLLP